MERNPPCPQCGGHATREGSLKELKAVAFKYFCTACKTYFSTFTGTIFHYLNAVPRVVSLSLELANQYGLSLRKASRLLCKRFDMVVAKSTLGEWNAKLAGASLNVEKPSFSNVWHIDEVFVRHEKRSPGGKRKWFDYLWVVCDDANNVIALHLSRDRSQKSAEAALEKARLHAGFSPRVLVSDEYCVYPNACRRVLGRGTLHVQAHFALTQFFKDGIVYALSNNRVERLNSTLRHRLRALRGYKNLASGARFFERLAKTLNACRLVDLADALLN